MSFEEEFPSLKGRRQEPCGDEGHVEWHDEKGPHCSLCPEGDFVGVKDIQENCKDNKRVLDGIEKKISFFESCKELNRKDINNETSAIKMGVLMRVIKELKELKKELEL